MLKLTMSLINKSYVVFWFGAVLRTGLVMACSYRRDQCIEQYIIGNWNTSEKVQQECYLDNSTPYEDPTVEACSSLCEPSEQNWIKCGDFCDGYVYAEPCPITLSPSTSVIPSPSTSIKTSPLPSGSSTTTELFFNNLPVYAHVIIIVLLVIVALFLIILIIYCKTQHNRRDPAPDAEHGEELVSNETIVKMDSTAEQAQQEPILSAGPDAEE